VTAHTQARGGSESLDRDRYEVVVPNDSEGVGIGREVAVAQSQKWRSGASGRGRRSSPQARCTAAGRPSTVTALAGHGEKRRRRPSPPASPSSGSDKTPALPGQQELSPFQPGPVPMAIEPLSLQRVSVASDAWVRTSVEPRPPYAQVAGPSCDRSAGSRTYCPLRCVSAGHKCGGEPACTPDSV